MNAFLSRLLLLVALTASVGLGAIVTRAGEDPADAEPAKPAVLDIRALDARSGKAVVGARVVVYDEAYEPIREGESDAGGEIRFFLPQGRYGAVAAFAEGYAFGHAQLYSLTGRMRERTYVLRLPEAHVLEGRVLRARGGEPIVGARVALLALTVGGMNRSIFWRFHEVVEETETNEDGRFTLRRIAWTEEDVWDRTLGALEVEADGYADVTKVLWRPQDLGEEFTVLLPEGGRVEGTVRLPDGTPARDVLVGSPTASGRGGGVDYDLLSSEDFWFTNSSLPRTPPAVDLWRGHETRTDALGHYVLEGLVAGHTVPIRAKLEEPERRATRVLEIPRSGVPARADLMLRGDASLEVRVSRGALSVKDGLLSGRGATWTPVPDAAVELRRGGFPPTYTDENGTVRFEGLPPGRHVVVASKEGLGEREEHVTLSVGGETTARVRFWSTGPDATYRGRIVDDRGQPIANALFSVLPGASEAKTDADGRFSVEAPRLEGLWLEAQAEGHAGRRRALADVEDFEALAFVLPRMTPVTLHVLAPSGQRLPARHIGVSWVGWGTWRARAEWSDPQTPLALTQMVDPDTPWISLDAGPYAPLVWKVAIEAGVPLDLPPQKLDSGLTLEGTLLDAEGRPVDGRRTYGEDLGHDFPYYEVEVYQRPHALSGPGAWRDKSAVPDAQGRWRIEGLVAGPTVVDVSLRYDSWRRFEIAVESGMEGLEIRLPEPCRLAGQVVDAEGHPQVQATVLLYVFQTPRWPKEEQRQLFREVPTDSGGRYEFEIPPGSYRLAVVSEADRVWRENVLVARALVLEAGEIREVDLVTPIPTQQR